MAKQSHTKHEDTSTSGTDGGTQDLKDEVKAGQQIASPYGTTKVFISSANPVAPQNLDLSNVSKSNPY